VPLYLGATPAPTDSRVYRAVFLNADLDNPEPEKVLEYLRQADADLVVLVEVTPTLMKALEPLQPAYPYARSSPRNDGRGIAVWSRLAWDDIEVREFDPSGFLSVVARFSLAGNRLTVIGTHPPWPMGATCSEHRNQQFAELARFATAQEGQVMILGDMNCTSWSPHFQDLLRGSGLQDSRQGFGIQPSWPAWLPLPLIAIDHCLASPGVIIHDRRIGPEVGSDHYPVVVEFSILPGFRSAGFSPLRGNRTKVRTTTLESGSHCSALP